MDLKKERIKKYVITVSVIILILLGFAAEYFINYNNFKPYIPKFLIITQLSGKCYLISDNSKSELKLNSKILLKNKEALIKIEDKGRIMLSTDGWKKNYYSLTKSIKISEYIKILNSLKEKTFYKNKKRLKFSLKFLIIFMGVLLLWILYTYLKNIRIIYSYLIFVISGIVILFIAGILLPAFGLKKIFSTVYYGMGYYIISNLLFFIILFILIKKSKKISEEGTSEDKGIKLLFDGYYLCEKKKYEQAYKKFKKASVLLPQRKDIKKLNEILEIQINEPEKLGKYINARDKFLLDIKKSIIDNK